MKIPKEIILISILIFATCILVGLGAARAVAKSIPTASDLLDRYTQALESTKSFIDHYEKNTEYRYRFRADRSNPRFSGIADSGKNFERGQTRYDGQRFYTQTYGWGDINSRIHNVPEATPYYWCKINEGERWYSNHRPMINNPTFSGTAETHVYKGPGKPELKPIPFNGVSYLVGYLDSGNRVDTILHGAENISVRQETETIRGSACYVIDADTKYGKYTVWLDPEHGYHPAKIRHRAKEGDYFKKYRMSKGDTGTAYLDIVRFEMVDGVCVPMEMNAGFHRIAGSPEYFNKENTHYKRTQIKLNPDHDKLGSFADPILEDPNNDPELINGTRVHLNSVPIQYIWQDGNIVDANGKVIMSCCKKSNKPNKEVK